MKNKERCKIFTKVMLETNATSFFVFSGYLRVEFKSWFNLDLLTSISRVVGIFWSITNDINCFWGSRSFIDCSVETESVLLSPRTESLRFKSCCVINETKKRPKWTAAQTKPCTPWYLSRMTQNADTSTLTNEIDRSIVSDKIKIKVNHWEIS